MWKVGRIEIGSEVLNFKTNDGAIPISDNESTEDASRLIWVFPEKQAKRGKGWEHKDSYSENLAQKLCDFLNKENL